MYTVRVPKSVVGQTVAGGGHIDLVRLSRAAPRAPQQADVHQVANKRWFFLCLLLECAYPCVLVHALPTQILTLRNLRGFVLRMNWPQCVSVSSARPRHVVIILLLFAGADAAQLARV